MKSGCQKTCLFSTFENENDFKERVIHLSAPIPVKPKIVVNYLATVAFDRDSCGFKKLL